jgi:hypothetical protein
LFPEAAGKEEGHLEEVLFAVEVVPSSSQSTSLPIFHLDFPTPAMTS